MGNDLSGEPPRKIKNRHWPIFATLSWANACFRTAVGHAELSKFVEYLVSDAEFERVIESAKATLLKRKTKRRKNSRKRFADYRLGKQWVTDK